MNIVYQDITTVERGVICHIVNCQGKMNSGVAKAIRNKWPVVYKEYFDYHRFWSVENGVRTGKLLGGVLTVKVDDGLFVANLFAQNNYGYDGKKYVSYDAFDTCLEKMKKRMKDKRYEDWPVYFPYNIGSDRGGGNFMVIMEIIDQYFPDATFCKI